MKTMKLGLAALVGFIALGVPGGVWADNIVDVTVSNISFEGRSVCGMSGTAICTESLNASFQWDDSTNTYVAGSFSSTESGALGSSFSVVGPEAYYSSNSVSFFLTDSSGDQMFVTILEGASGLVSGTFTAPISSVYDVFVPGTTAGEFNADLVCAPSPSLCGTYYSPFSAYVYGGAPDVTVGSVTVPEPSSLFLLGTGLMALLGMTLRSTRSV